jgi:hypothetical protein
MAMTREQVLAEMEASYAKMPEETRNRVLYNEMGTDWTPTLLLAEVRNDTEYGKLYVQSWGAKKEQDDQLLQLLQALLGGGGAEGEEILTCGDPDCPNCHGEVRPLYGDTGTEPTKH